MDTNDPFFLAAAASLVLLMLSLLAMRRRNGARSGRPGRPTQRDALDTVAAWPPEAARVLTATERKAFDLLTRAAPGEMVLAQVPLARFVRVPTRHSYTEWMQRVGRLNADLVLCDAGSRVLAVVDIRSPGETERSRRRHERLGRVLRAAGVPVLVWYENELPALNEVRALLGAALHVDVPASTASRPMPLIPVPEIEELLADGDSAVMAMEPVPSAFIDDLELVPATRG